MKLMYIMTVEILPIVYNDVVSLEMDFDFN